MTSWKSDELNQIAAAEEVRIASERADATLRKPVIVWLVRLDDDLYVRSVNGRSASWFRGVLDRHAGRISADGFEKNIAFVESDDVNDEIDAAYQAKYRRYPSIVPSIVSDKARAATLKLIPHS